MYTRVSADTDIHMNFIKYGICEKICLIHGYQGNFKYLSKKKKVKKWREVIGFLALSVIPEYLLIVCYFLSISS